MTNTKRRKRNWNAGLTKAQHALAIKIGKARIDAFYKERADGTMGLPGSMWEIGSDGLGRTHKSGSVTCPS